MSHYLFQLTDRVMDQSYELHKTTQGLYIYMESINRLIMINNNSKSKIDELLGRLSNSFSKHELKASSLYEIQLAEQDYEMKSLEGEFQSKFTQEYIKDCSIFLNQLSILAHFDRQIHKVRDMKGREAFVYSLYGQLFVPKCDFFSKLLIRTEKDKQCFSYVQVEAIDRRNKSIILFLNSRNFLLDHSNRINCSAVNTRQMINSTHFLIRVGNLVKVQSIADLKLIDLTSQNYDFDNLNFDHHGEIVDGFELIDKLHDKPSSSVDNDLNEKFHILPEDNVEEKHHVIADWAHSISNSISNFWDSITSAIHSFFMSILLIFFIISFVFVLKFCIKLFK